MILVLAELCSFFNLCSFSLAWTLTVLFDWKLASIEIIERMRPYTPAHIPEFNLMLTFAGHSFSFRILCYGCSVQKDRESLGPRSSKLYLCFMAWKGAAVRRKDSKSSHIQRIVGIGRLSPFSARDPPWARIPRADRCWGSIAGNRGWHAVLATPGTIHLRATSLMLMRGFAPELQRLWDCFGMRCLWEEWSQLPVQLRVGRQGLMGRQSPGAVPIPSLVDLSC